jgi:hypothetical protein
MFNLRGNFRLHNPHHLLVAFIILSTLAPSVHSKTHGPRCSKPKTSRASVRSSQTANLSGIPRDVLQISHWQVHHVYLRIWAFRGLYHYLEDLPPHHSRENPTVRERGGRGERPGKPRRGKELGQDFNERLIVPIVFSMFSHPCERESYLVLVPIDPALHDASHLHHYPRLIHGLCYDIKRTRPDLQ